MAAMLSTFPPNRLLSVHLKVVGGGHALPCPLFLFSHTPSRGGSGQFVNYPLSQMLFDSGEGEPVFTLKAGRGEGTKSIDTPPPRTPQPLPCPSQLGEFSSPKIPPPGLFNPEGPGETVRVPSSPLKGAPSGQTSERLRSTQQHFCNCLRQLRNERGYKGKY